MKKILLLIPIFLIFIPSYVFAETPEKYTERVTVYCESEFDCSNHSFVHVPGKPFTINIKTNVDEPMSIVIFSDTEGGGWIYHEYGTAFKGNFVKTYETEHDEVSVDLSRDDDSKPDIEFELLFSGYRYPVSINFEPFPLTLLLFLSIPLIITFLSIIAITINRKRKKPFKEDNKKSLPLKDKNSEIIDYQTLEKSSFDQENPKFIKILKKRLAKGEITLEEYDDLKEEFRK